MTEQENELYDQESERLESVLRPKLTDEFLSTLADAVRTCGWSVDYFEVVYFTEWCYRLADKEMPDLTLFQEL